VSAFFALVVFEGLKEWVWPDATKWQSHLVTVGFGTVFVGLGSYVALRIRRLNDELRAEVLSRRQAEQASRESEERFRQLAETAADAILTMDETGRIRYANAAAERTFGYPLTELLGQALTLLMPSRLSERYWSALAEYLQSGREHVPWQALEMLGRHKDGREVPIELSFGEFTEGGVRVFAGIIRDTTERKYAEAQIQKLNESLERRVAEQTREVRAAEEKYRTLVEQLPAITYRYALSKRNAFLYISPQVRTILGLEPEDLEADPNLWSSLLHPDDRDRAFDLAAQTRSTDRPTATDVRVVRADGEIVYLRNHALVVRDDEDQPAYIQGVLVDVTEYERERAARERMELMSQRLVEVQEGERRRLARELHDEIGQLLTGLKLILESCTNVSPSPRAERLGEALALVNELLGRVRALSLDLRPAMLDDLGLLPALLWFLERYNAQTGVKVDFRHSRLETRFSPAVETAAYRIVQEALTNVARHAQASQVRVSVWVTSEYLGVQVQDNGVGFDAVAALRSGRTSGLAGMRERCTLLGGTLALESEPQQGSRLIAELPLLPEGRVRNGDHDSAG
jgi:PAS domain S-box-containing protein